MSVVRELLQTLSAAQYQPWLRVVAKAGVLGSGQLLRSIRSLLRSLLSSAGPPSRSADKLSCRFGVVNGCPGLKLLVSLQEFHTVIHDEKTLVPKEEIKDW